MEIDRRKGIFARVNLDWGFVEKFSADCPSFVASIVRLILIKFPRKFDVNAFPIDIHGGWLRIRFRSAEYPARFIHASKNNN